MCRPRLRRIAVDAALAGVVAGLLAQRWSPEQVAHELRVLFAGQRRRWLCVESIYQAIYDPAVELTRPARRRRRRRRLAGLHRRGRLTAMTMIHQRPVEVEDRVQLGHWEGDLIMGPSNRSAIGTLIERNTRFVILLAFPGAVPTADAVRHADHHRVREPARRAAADADLGSRQGARAAPADHRQHRHPRVLLRRARALAARQQREHERPPARLLRQRHRPQRPHRRRGPARRPGDQPPPPQDARLEPARRALRHRARRRLNAPHTHPARRDRQDRPLRHNAPLEGAHVPGAREQHSLRWLNQLRRFAAQVISEFEIFNNKNPGSADLRRLRSSNPLLRRWLEFPPSRRGQRKPSFSASARTPAASERG